MRVSRSLTIKQMAMVAAVSMVFVFVFCVILLFHFLQQNRYNTATQLESIARSVREPLSAAILKGDIPQAETILKQINPAGVVSRADVVLPNQFQALRMRFIPERPVPVTITRIFELPVQISLPIYSLERPVNPQPLAYLVLQADSYRVYKFIISTISTLVTAYLLLTLMITVALTWCINRLVVHPLRRIARELNELPVQEHVGHQLALPRHHHDDEIGILVRSYNRNQQMLLRQHEELTLQSTRYPVSELPNKALLLALLEQTLARQQATALLIVSCETLQDSAGVLQEAQREMLLLTLTEKLKATLTPGMTLAQVSGYDFAIIADDVTQPWQAMSLGQQVLTVINERVPLQGVQLRPAANIGVALSVGKLSAEQLYHRATSAAMSARRKGKNQLAFFEPEQLELARQHLAYENTILSALEQGHFALWLQPQVALASGEVVSANVMLYTQQPEASPEAIEASGLLPAIGGWLLEESCRLLSAWQARGIMLPLSVKLPALQLQQQNSAAHLLELLHRYRIAPGTLLLEVTESRQLDDAQAILQPLHEAGVRIALDDIGTGFARLRQLSPEMPLPVDMLKLDKLFVANFAQQSSLAAAVISLAHSLNLQVLADGVENDAQHSWLAARGVEIAQGEWFAAAAPADTFEQRYFSPLDNAENP